MSAEIAKGIVDFSIRPSLGELGNYLSQMRVAPIDGVMVRLDGDDGSNYGNRVFGGGLLSRDRLRNAEEGLRRAKAIGFGKLRYNFIVIQIQSSVPWGVPGYLDQLSNFLMLLKFCSEQGVYGICFDVEPYDGKVWEWDNQLLKGSISFSAMKSLVYSFGYTLGSEWQGKYSDVALMTTFGYEQYVNGLAPFEGNEYGLWASMLDGIYDGAGGVIGSNTGKAPLILGSEQGYGERDQFNMLHYGLYELSNHVGYLPADRSGYGGNSVYFGEIEQYGMALYMDKPSFNPSTPDSNYWTPGALADMVGYLLTVSNFVWIYSGDYHFYGHSLVPTEYFTALNKVRAANGLKVGDGIPILYS